MTTTIATSRATTLGPFLTLLILTRSRRTHTSRRQLSPEKTAPIEPYVDGAEFEVKLPETHHGGIVLGPFLTLILTLHRRRGRRASSARQPASFAQAAPILRTRAAG
jgi:hypothetical protein